MEKNYRDKLFNKDVLESGLSINTINLLRMMGYSKVSDVFNEGPLSYEKLYDKVMSFSNLYCKICGSLEDLQHSYIELTQYLRHYGVKFIEERHVQKTILK